MTLDETLPDDAPPELEPHDAIASAPTNEQPPEAAPAVSSGTAEIERLSAVHGERVRELEAERWRLGERISALEAKNLDLQGDLLEQTRALNQELNAAKRALTEEQQARLSEASTAREQEAQRTEALRRELACELRAREERAEQLLTELLRAKDAMVAHVRDSDRALQQQHARAADHVAEVRRELTAELKLERERTEALLAQLLRTKDDLLELQQRHALELAAQRSAWAELENMQRRRLQESEERVERGLATLRQQMLDEITSQRHSSSREVEAMQAGALEELAAVRLDLERTQNELDVARAALQEAQATRQGPERDDRQRLERELQATRAAELNLEEKSRVLQERLDALEGQAASAQANQGEVMRLRQRMAAMEIEAQKYRRAATTLEGNVEKTKNTLSFRLGYVLIHGPKSWAGLKRMPSELLGLHAEAKRRRAAKLGTPQATRTSSPSSPAAGRPSRPEQFVDEVMRLYSREGAEAAGRFAEFGASDDQERAAALTQLAKALKAIEPRYALTLAERAYALEPQTFRAKWLAFLKYDCGDISSAAELVSSLPASFALKPSEKARAAEILGLSRVVNRPFQVPARAPCSVEPIPDSALYVAASAVPFHVSGYTVRTQSLLRALIAAGVRLTAALRPGYPWDRGVDLPEQSGLHTVEGVTYMLLPGRHVRKTGLDEYVEVAAEKILEVARRVQPEVIHAASNHVNALPALLAARRLGVPFVYEVRGMWELTAATRHVDWERSERFALEQSLELLVASHADHVLTLTEGLAQDLVARGVPRERISLIPNSVDPARFAPRRKDSELMLRFGLNSSSFTIAYAGSVLHYEGLDDVVRAVALLVEGGVDAALVVAGDGEAIDELKRLSHDLGVERRVKLVGRLAPEDVPRLWSLADVAAFARKPFRVCELVSPLKPLEPMVMGIPVVVSSVAALREMVQDGQTGLVHTSGDAASLAQKLRQLADDPAERQRLGQAARELVLSERTWDSAAERIVDVYRRIKAESMTPIVELPPGRSSMSADEKLLFEERLEQAYARGQGSAVSDLARRQASGRSERLLAFCLLKAAGCCQRYGDALAPTLAREALVKDDSAGTLRGVARIVYAAGDFAGALQVVNRLESAVGALTGKDDELAREVRSRNRLLEVLSERRAVGRPATTPNKSVYFLHFSLPYSSVGYATRSHGLLAGIKAEGYDTRAYTRCGFPHDFKAELEGQSLPELDVVDGIEYHRLLEGGRRGSSESEYLLNCADAYERVLLAERPEVVHAASNYVTALPALIAARRLGLPFIYEIRGFWEITRSSRDNEFQSSARFALMKHFENLVAGQADHVFTLTSAMKAELVRRGVDEAKISLVHNGVDGERFVPLAPRLELAARIGLPSGVPVLGYVGSFVDYEGLDDLIRASAILSSRGSEFRLLMVGDGAMSDELRALATREGVADRVVFTGRVPHDEVEAYYSLIDICPFPRKPWEVCEMVSPLKPFEAMAMGKAVVVSSTHALREIVDDGVTGLVFEKGSADSLASALQKLVEQPGLRERLAKDGRAWTLQHRTWRDGARVVVEQYRALVARRNRLERVTA